MKKVWKSLLFVALLAGLFAIFSCKQNDDSDDEYIAPVTKVFTVTNTINGDVYKETITTLMYKNIYSFEKRTGLSYRTEYEIDVTEQINSYYSSFADAMKEGGYVIAELHSTGTKNETPLSVTNCFRRDGNKFYLNSDIYYY